MGHFAMVLDLVQSAELILILDILKSGEDLNLLDYHHVKHIYDTEMQKQALGGK
jgi:hypothetical protein